MQSVRNVAYRSRRNGRASPVLILFVRESRTFAATRTACRSLAEEGTPRPTGEQADEDDDRRREVIGQGTTAHSYSKWTKRSRRSPSAKNTTAVATPRIQAHRRRKSSPQPIAICSATGNMTLQ